MGPTRLYVGLGFECFRTVKRAENGQHALRPLTTSSTIKGSAEHRTRLSSESGAGDVRCAVMCLPLSSQVEGLYIHRGGEGEQSDCSRLLYYPREHGDARASLGVYNASGAAATAFPPPALPCTIWSLRIILSMDDAATYKA